MSFKILKKEDYEEPCCILSSPTTKQMIPIPRVIEKLDEHLSRNDYPSAERHLNYWLSEAEAVYDDKGRLTVLNEQIGLYRKWGNKEKSLRAAENAITLAEKLGMTNTVTLATTYVNAATAYKAFDMAKTALPYYEKAKPIYEELLTEDDLRLGGLYNNMAITVSDCGDMAYAEKLFYKAIDVMKKIKGGEGEIAVTYLNLADLCAKRKGTIEGEKEIGEYLDKALALLDTPELSRDGRYAFICEKCAPVFMYYGYFFVANDLKKRAKDIYERT